jgi:hypothetical protein
MSQPHWFDIVGPEYQAQVIKVLNRRSFHLPAFVPKQDSIPFEKYYAGLLTGDLLRKFRREAREAWKDQPLGLERLREVVRWRDGLEPLHPKIRKCGNARCGTFFAVTNRLSKTYCDRPCTTSETARRSMKAKHEKVRRPLLARARRAVKRYGHLTDWKRRAAEAAGVKMNFISYAIRRGEILAPGTAPPRRRQPRGTHSARSTRKGAPARRVAHIGSKG